MDPRGRPPRRESEAVHRDGMPPVCVLGHLDVRRDDERRAGEAHGPDPDVVPERRQLRLERGHLRGPD